MNIRPSEERDLEALQQLASISGRKFESKLENTWVAEHEGEIIGYIALNPELKEDKWLGKHYETSALIVKDEYLGEGVVTKLIQHLTAKLKKEGLNLKLRH